MNDNRISTRPGSRVRRGIGALIALAVLLGALAGLVPARAAEAAAGISSGGSIVHIKDNDVWLTSPDGVTQKRLTTDGSTPTADGTGDKRYAAPSQSDLGDVIVAIRHEFVSPPGYTDGYLWVMNRQGQLIHPPFKPRQFVHATGGPCQGPMAVPVGITDAEVSPDGTKIAYEATAHLQSSACEDLSNVKHTWVVNIDGSGAQLITRQADGSPTYLERPSWVGNSRILLNERYGGLYYVDLPGTSAVQWADTSDDDVYSQPAIRNGKLVTADQFAKRFSLWTASGPSTMPVARCEYFTPAGGWDNGEFGALNWAPDGNALVWKEGDDTPDEAGEGVYVMAVGDIAAGCPADSARQLLIPGGLETHWGPAPVTLPTLAVNDVSVAEGNSGTRTATFTIARSGSATGPSRVAWATANGTAAAGADYIGAAGTADFAAGQTTKTVAVTVNGDAAVEANETFSVNLSAASGATIADGSGAGTIVNDDGPTLAINDALVTEGNSGTIAANFTITRSGGSTGSASVSWATANGTAVAGGDYVAVASAPVTFAAGETTKTVSVDVKGDTTGEANETFTVKLTAPTGATVSDDTGVGTIVDDDSPTYAVSDVSVAEGDSGTTTANFTVTRSRDATRTSSVAWYTVNGSATAGSDFVGVPVTRMAFTAGETVKQASVTINGDPTVELNERFFVKLAAPSVGSSIVDATGFGTITNDDATTVTVNDVSMAEGDSGSKVATFTITRSSAVGTGAVSWYTLNGTATAGSDFMGVPGTRVTFAAGETTKQLPVAINGDSTVEPNETFFVKLAAPSLGFTIADGTGRGVIVDNDATAFSVNDVSVTEGDSGTSVATFTITRSGTTAAASSVTWNTVNGTAVAGSDYVGVGATVVNFGIGETTKSAGVIVNGDTAAEANEALAVKLTSPTGATIADDTGVGTVTNDDVTTFSVNDVSVAEGHSDTRTATFTVTRSGATGGTDSVKWNTVNGTAVAGSDYVAVGATEVTFAPGQTTRPAAVTVNGDSVVEPDESFLVKLTAPSVATAVADDTGVGTITNDDATTISVNDVSVAEGNSGSRSLPFTITRSSGIGTASVAASIAGGPATRVTFAAGETTKSVSFPFLPDTIVEPDEIVLVKLSAATGAVIADDTGVGTITNDDGPDQHYPYTMGQTVRNGVPWEGAGNLEAAGHLDRYTFTATAGQKVFVDAFDLNCWAPWRLTGPTGTVVFSGNICGDPGQFTLAVAGTYTLTVGSPTGATTAVGPYGFSITNVP